MILFNPKDEEDFIKTKEKAEEFYKELGPLWCPYFKESVVFNTKGIHHLKFKSDTYMRSEAEQYARLKLLSFVPEVLSNSHTLQGILPLKKFEKVKTNSRWEKILKEVNFYEFIAVVKNIRIKVIIKEVQGGEKYFWSVIPFWKYNKSKGIREIHSIGDREELE